MVKTKLKSSLAEEAPILIKLDPEVHQHCQHHHFIHNGIEICDASLSEENLPRPICPHCKCPMVKNGRRARDQVVRYRCRNYRHSDPAKRCSYSIDQTAHRYQLIKQKYGEILCPLCQSKVHHRGGSGYLLRFTCANPDCGYHFRFGFNPTHLRKLTPKEAELFDFAYAQGAMVKELARALNLSISACRRRIARLKAKAEKFSESVN